MTHTFLDGLTGLAAYVAADRVDSEPVEPETVTISKADWRLFQILAQHGMDMRYVDLMSLAGDVQRDPEGFYARCCEIVERD